MKSKRSECLVSSSSILYTAVVILNYNNWEDTINCVESVEQYNSSPIKYIIIDNGSTRPDVVANLTNQLMKRFSHDFCLYKEDSSITNLPRVSLILSNENVGYAQGNNMGIKLAYSDDSIINILILNNDILFVEDILPRLLAKSAELDNCAIVSPVLYKRDLKGIDYNCAKNNPGNWDIILTYLFLYRNFFGFLKRKNKRMFILENHPEYLKRDCFEIQLPSGSCMLINKGLMHKIGGFDPNTFLYYEEPILYKKIVSLGMKNYLVPNLKCIHLGASSTSKEPSVMITYHLFKSIDYYFLQYSPLNTIQKIVYRIAKTVYLKKIELKNLIIVKK